LSARIRMAGRWGSGPHPGNSILELKNYHKQLASVNKRLNSTKV
jgi:hypothetical protein